MDKEYQHKTIRKECSDEQTLISHRMTWLLMTQAFLFTTFAISLANGAVKQFWVFTFIVVPLLGCFVAVAILRAIKAAITTLDFWHQQESNFLEDNTEYKPLDRSGRGEKVHWLSMRFPQLMPVTLISTWLFLAIFGLVQGWLNILPQLP